MEIQIQEELYAIRNKQGKWFRRQGSLHGPSWVDEFKKATVYNNTSVPRQIISQCAKLDVEGGVPDLVIIKIDKVELIEETERIRKSKQRKAGVKLRREIEYKEYQRRRAEEDLWAAKKKLEDLNGR